MRLLLFLLIYLPFLSSAEKVESSQCEGVSLENDLRSLRSDLFELIIEKHCNPILVRFAWHDSGTYDASIDIMKWPKCGGANGSIRFQPEIQHGANAGLSNAIDLLSGLKNKYDSVSWADLIQMASAVAVEQAGGPRIEMKYGRIDVVSPDDCAIDGNLPGAMAPFPHGEDAGSHLRRVFYRMGFGDREIVALSGAHTLGRAYKDRSGTGKEKTKFTSGSEVDPMDKGMTGYNYGREGGSSWTKNWLVFDNSYFKTLMDTSSDSELLRLDSDNVLVADTDFNVHVQRYAANQKVFFDEYALAHKKLSELGAKFFPEEGIVL